MGRGARVALGFLVACAVGSSGFARLATATPPVPAEERSGEAELQPRSTGLAFTDHTGRAVSDSDFAGRYMLVFFGYTHCPDVCPGDLGIMSAAMRALGSAAGAVVPVFITFDPERDTPEVLAEYVRQFHPQLTGLTGTREQIAEAARSYGVVFERYDDEDGPGASDYSLRHTALTYLIGPDGKGVATFDHGSDPNEMAGEILGLLEQEPVASRAGESS